MCDNFKKAIFWLTVSEGHVYHNRRQGNRSVWQWQSGAENSKQALEAGVTFQAMLWPTSASWGLSPWGDTTSQNNVTSWGPSAQTHEPMRTFHNETITWSLIIHNQFSDEAGKGTGRRRRLMILKYVYLLDRQERVLCQTGALDSPSIY